MRMVPTSLLLLVSIASTCLHAESKRIEVYPLTQTYVDTRSGDTLGEIAASLLPNNPSLQQSLMQDIIEMNPGAFTDQDADRMLADRRLWLPNTMSQPDSKVDTSKYQVESFSWGNIKRRR